MAVSPPKGNTLLPSAAVSGMEAAAGAGAAARRCTVPAKTREHGLRHEHPPGMGSLVLQAGKGSSAPFTGQEQGCFCPVKLSTDSPKPAAFTRPLEILQDWDSAYLCLPFEQARCVLGGSAGVTDPRLQPADTTPISVFSGSHRFPGTQK